MCIDCRRRQAGFIALLNDMKSEKWARINDKFAKSEVPAGQALMTTGCMERYQGPRDEERTDKVRGERLVMGSGLESYKEQQNMNQVTSDMSLDEVLDVLNPEEVLPWQ